MSVEGAAEDGEGGSPAAHDNADITPPRRTLVAARATLPAGTMANGSNGGTNGGTNEGSNGGWHGSGSGSATGGNGGGGGSSGGDGRATRFLLLLNKHSFLDANLAAEVLRALDGKVPIDLILDTDGVHDGCSWPAAVQSMPRALISRGLGAQALPLEWLPGRHRHVSAMLLLRQLGAHDGAEQSCLCAPCRCLGRCLGALLGACCCAATGSARHDDTASARYDAVSGVAPAVASLDPWLHFVCVHCAQPNAVRASTLQSLPTALLPCECGESFCARDWQLEPITSGTVAPGKPLRKSRSSRRFSWLSPSATRASSAAAAASCSADPRSSIVSRDSTASRASSRASIRDSIAQHGSSIVQRNAAPSHSSRASQVRQSHALQSSQPRHPPAGRHSSTHSCGSRQSSAMSSATALPRRHSAQMAAGSPDTGSPPPVPAIVLGYRQEPAPFTSIVVGYRHSSEAPPSLCGSCSSANL